MSISENDEPGATAATSTALAKLTIFSDAPFFEGNTSNDHDAFSHRAFAEAIYTLIKEN